MSISLRVQILYIHYLKSAWSWADRISTFRVVERFMVLQEGLGEVTLEWVDMLQRFGERRFLCIVWSYGLSIWRIFCFIKSDVYIHGNHSVLIWSICMVSWPAMVNVGKYTIPIGYVLWSIVQYDALHVFFEDLEHLETGRAWYGWIHQVLWRVTRWGPGHMESRVRWWEIPTKVWSLKSSENLPWIFIRVVCFAGFVFFGLSFFSLMIDEWLAFLSKSLFLSELDSGCLQCSCSLQIWHMTTQIDEKNRC